MFKIKISRKKVQKLHAIDNSFIREKYNLSMAVCACVV